jgi:hypothetical protein
MLDLDAFVLTGATLAADATLRGVGSFSGVRLGTF